MSLKSRVEAALFLTDKPIVAAAIAKLVNEDVQLVRQAVLELIHDYEERNSALEIANDDEGYMMQVKDEFANLANNLAPIDLPVSVVRTLSAIAIKQPVLQSEIVRIRGAGAYEHIKELEEKELISKKEEGRSSLLSTTKKFQEYFRLSQDAKALRYQLKDQAKESAEGIPAEQQLHLPLEGEQPAQTGAEATVAVNPLEEIERQINIQEDVEQSEESMTNFEPSIEVEQAGQNVLPIQVDSFGDDNIVSSNTQPAIGNTITHTQPVT